MIEKKKCENQHKMIIDWESGYICDRPCVNAATKYIVDSFGIFYLCEECYKDDCKRRIDSDSLTLKNKGV